MATTTTTSKKNLSPCSPVSSRPRNLHARNSEATDPMRRSFSARIPFSKPSIMAVQRGGGLNPSTPANSPSDCPQRKSISRESIIDTFHDYEDKENGKDHNWKQAKVRSLSTKNFMSLTTSAASKINASPRKKILNESNKTIRTSVSVPDVKSPSAEDLGSKAAKCLNQKKEVSSDSTITCLEEMEVPKNDVEESLKNDEDIGSFFCISAQDHSVLLSEHATMEKDSVNLDPSFKISPKELCSLPCPRLEPLDAEPSMLPYDPKTNYLSPRPQFLHYRPNPRIEHYLNKGSDGMQFEGSFISESYSDIEVTEDEPQSVGSRKEFQDVSSGDLVKQVEEKVVIEDDEALPVTQLNISTFKGVKLTEEKKVSKAHLFRRKRLLTVLPLLAVTCFLVLLSNSLVMDSYVVDNLSFSVLYVPPEISELTRKSLEGIAQQFRLQLNLLICWSNNLVASFRESHKLGSLKYNNLSILLNDGLVDSDHMFDHSALGSQHRCEDNVLGPNNEGDDGGLAEEELQSKEAEEEVENQIELEHQRFEEQGDIVAGYVEDVEIVPENKLDFPIEFGVSEPEELNLAPQVKAIRPGNSEREAMEEEIESADCNVELQSETYLEDKPIPIPEARKTEQVFFNAGQPQGETDVNQFQSETYHEDKPIPIPDASKTEQVFFNAGQPQGETDVNQFQSETYHEDKPIPIPDARKTEQVFFNAGQPQGETDVNQFQSETYLEDKPIPIPDASKTEQVFFNAGQPQGETDVNHAEPVYGLGEKVPESLYSDAALISPQNLETGNPALNGVKDTFSAKFILQISLLALSLLLAATSFICVKNQRIITQNAASAVVQVPHHNKKMNNSPMSISAEYTFLETNVDMTGDSCPSEMSSSSHINKGIMWKSEAQSSDPRPRKSNRRESLVSSDSSMGSPSYGSFTAYEKISSKHGSKDEEVITPVRRSSRIRNHVTSL